MTCDETRSAMIAGGPDEVTTATLAAVLLHLSICEACREIFRGGSTAPSVADKGYLGRILDRLAADPEAAAMVDEAAARYRKAIQ